MARYPSSSDQAKSCVAAVYGLDRGFRNIRWRAARGAPRAARHLMFLNPRSSPYTAATQLFAWSLDEGYRAIAFTKARKITELLHSWLLPAPSRYEIGRASCRG